MARTRKVAVLVALLGLLSACPQQPVVTTTRNLNRPGPLAMVCAARVGDAGITTGLNPSACTPSATDGGVSGLKPHLFGFVANTARGEVAVFQSVTTGEPLVDLDRRSPGYGFIPVGSFPTDLKASTDGCRVISANAGSCDLSIINVPAVLRFAAGTLPTPSGAAVSRLIPKTAAGAPLRSQPQELVLIPSSIPAKKDTDECPSKPPKGSYRAYVSFPRCNLVAELDLLTGQILHGVQIRPDGTFVFTENPVCPVDCILAGESKRVDAGVPPDAARDAAEREAQAADRGRDAGAPVADKSKGDAQRLEARAPEAAAPIVDAGPPDASRPEAGSPLDGGGPGTVSRLGVLPSGLALLTDGKGDRLFISSAGAGFISVIDTDPITGTFVLKNPPRLILLADRPATTRIRLSPPPRTQALGRFLYAVASDRTVRVISTENEKECETQLDLRAVPVNDKGVVPFNEARCYPVGGPLTPPRRITAKGHGLTFGAGVPQDVVFVQSGKCSEAGVCQAPLPEAGVFPEIGATAVPLRGIFAIVVTSDGNAYVIDVEDWNVVTKDSTGFPPPLQPPYQLPHRFRNELQGTTKGVPDAGVTSVTGAGSGGVPVIVSSRLENGKEVHLAGEGVTINTIGEAVGTPWKLVYEERLVARWSGDVKVAKDSLSLNDPGMDFCTADVRGTVEESGRKTRHGDIAVLVGCKDDTECGLEQRCVKPVAEQAEFGLCLEKSRADELAVTCNAFLRGKREYLVRQATQTTLTLDVLPAEPQKIILQKPQPPKRCESNADCDPYYLCALEGQPASKLSKGDCFRAGCGEGLDDCATATTGNTCEQPLDGSPKVCSAVPLPFESGAHCTTDSDCQPKKAEGAVCTTDLSCGDGALECRKASTAAADKTCFNKNMFCAQFPKLRNLCVRKSPCFTELQRYDVRAGRSFLVGSYRRGIADPVTRECRDDTTKPSLFVDRVPVGLPVYPVLLGAECQRPVLPAEPQPDPCFERMTTTGYVGYTLKGPGSTVTFTDVAPSTVVRFSNPDISFSVGVSHLTAVADTSTRPDGGAAVPLYPPMPARGLTIELGVQSGFSRLRAVTSPGGLSLPTRLEDAPDGFVYIVDTGDRSGSTGTRGQVVRINRSTLQLDSIVVR